MTSIDTFAGHALGLDSPYVAAAAVTRAINVVVAGNVKVTMLGGGTVVLAVAVGMTRLRVSRVWSASTTATGITALW